MGYDSCIEFSLAALFLMHHTLTVVWAPYLSSVFVAAYSSNNANSHLLGVLLTKSFC
jgi:hypothetical protein